MLIQHEASCRAGREERGSGQGGRLGRGDRGRFRQQEEQVRLAERRLAALTGESDLHARRLEEAQAQRAELQSRESGRPAWSSRWQSNSER